MRPSTPRTYQPVTSEYLQTLVGLPLAGFWARFAAFMIDLVIVIPFASIQEVLLRLDEIIKPNGDIKLEINPFHSWGLIPTVLYFALALYWGHGRTLGKRLLRIRVVSLTHEHITFWHALERALGYGASVLEGGFGFIQFFIHPNRQTVHDRIAETIVVRDIKQRSGLPPNSVHE
jgi:uncharacterized RDD family membrane protein YckC